MAALTAAAIMFAGVTPGDAGAVPAKCKGKKGKALKRCKKRATRKPTPAPPPLPVSNPSPPTPPPPPVLRIEIDWAEDADVDVHVWNATGTQHASAKSPNGIPGVSFSADDTDGSIGGGNEQVFAQPGDKLIVGICNNGSETLRSLDTDPPAVVNATAYEGVFGSTTYDLIVKTNEGSFAITTPSGPELPPGHPDTSGWCHPKRAEITWSNEVDLDLHVFDSAGNHASPASPYGIPGAYVTADVTGNAGAGDDYEEFIDRRFEQSRSLYFYFCVEALNGAPATLWDMDLYVYEPPFARQMTAIQAPPTLGDDGFLASSPQSAPYPPPFTLPNYCP